MSNIHKKRTAFKPFEYPEAIEFVDAINNSFWVHKEYNYQSDINDYHTKVSDVERDIIKKTMLIISQVEASGVKPFWGDIYKRYSKPEFNSVGATFAESEVRHSRAYAHLLEILGINDEFENIVHLPAVKGRIDYAEKHLKYSQEISDKDFLLVLILFSLFIENVSLFAQFLIIKSFNKEKVLFKGIDNVITATQKEETIHALFGSYLVNLVREENPEWFDDEFIDEIKKACKKAYKAETKILDWIFESGELSFLSRNTIDVFIKDRFNQSLEAIKIEPLFEVDSLLLEKTEWFNVGNLSVTHTDFFSKTSVNYNKKSKSVTENDLF